MTDDGRAAQLRAAAAVRALAGALVERVADADTLHELTEAVEKLTNRLAQGEPRDLREAYRVWFASGHAEESVIIERAVGGPANPTAVPISARPVGDDAVVADLLIPAVFAGWPGIAHGGVTAGILDDVLGHLSSRVAGPTVTTNLAIRYCRPAPVGRPLRAEARVVSRQGRQIHLAGAILDGDTELVTATGSWLTVDR